MMPEKDMLWEQLDTKQPPNQPKERRAGGIFGGTLFSSPEHAPYKSTAYAIYSSDAASTKNQIKDILGCLFFRLKTTT